MLNYDLSYYFNKYKQPIKWVSLVIFITLMIYVIVSLVMGVFERQGKIAVPVSLVPADATIYVDGEKISRSGTIYIKPGQRQVKVTSPGFESVEKTYRIYDYNAPGIYIGLIGQSDSAKKWQQNNQFRYRKLELLATEKAHQYNQLFEERNPIVKDLPIKDPYFTISYRNIDDKTIKLTIWGTSARYRQYALNYLRQLGYEPTDYEIEFSNFTNPLATNIQPKEGDS